MKRFTALFLMLPALWCRAQISPLPATNEVNWIHQAHSFDVGPNLQFYDSIDCYVYCMYPQFTNHLWSWSHSGSNLEEDYEDDEAARTMPFFHSVDTNLVAWDIFMAGDDNGGYTSNQIVQWSTNIMAGPLLVWNPTNAAATNEGITFPTVINLPIGGPPEDSATGGGLAQIARNDAATNLAGVNGLVMVDMWHDMWTNGVESDVTGSRLFGFFPGNHPFPAGYLCMALKTLIALGAETNIGSCVIDFNAATVRSTNHEVISGLQLTGNTLSWTVHYDRMPGAWDVPDGTITNDCRNAFVLMPQLGNAFQWTIQVTNLPAGFYSVAIDGAPVVSLTGAQLTAGWNMFTNYTGPLWNQRKAILAAKRDQEGNNHVTLMNAHTAGDLGVGGNRDLINYYSAATTYPGSFIGTNYTTAMAPVVAGMKALDVLIHNAAQQTNHTCSVTLITPRLAPFHR
jgi:hypothetical protein